MRLEHHLVGGYVRYISPPHIIIIIIIREYQNIIKAGSWIFPYWQIGQQVGRLVVWLRHGLVGLESWLTGWVSMVGLLAW